MSGLRSSQCRLCTSGTMRDYVGTPERTLQFLCGLGERSNMKLGSHTTSTTGNDLGFSRLYG